MQDNVNNNKVKIKLADIIYLDKYIDSGLNKYELFAVNIKNQEKDYSLVKKKGKWYKINEID
jgi:hypothetical protein